MLIRFDGCRVTARVAAAWAADRSALETPPAAETNAAPAGIASVSVTSEAGSGPWLVTSIVKATSSRPTVAVPGAADCATARSADGGTGTGLTAVNSEVLPAGSVAVMV